MTENVGMEWTMTSLEAVPQVVEAMLELASERQDDGKAVVLALHGDLGAGKTTVTQELARQLGVSETVVSPTFVVMKGYEANNEHFSNLVHIDAYRIEDVDEMRVMHFADILTENNTMIVIEWAERIAELLPSNTLHFDLTATDGTHVITFRHA